MAEIGLIASVIQVAGAGLKLSQTLYQYADSVASADRRIKDIAKEVQLTSFVIDELGDIFKTDNTSALLSKNALRTADETVKECSIVFLELDAALKKSAKGKMGKWLLPFKETKLDLLRAHVDKLKSTLQLLMQVLTHAHQVASRKLDHATEVAQREEIKALLQNKKDSTKRYEESLRKWSTSDDSTVVDDQDPHDFTLGNVSIASAIQSTITVESLGTCMRHVHSLLQDIEALQKTLSSNGKDASDHQQTLVGSYFRARGHLDALLLSNPQPPPKHGPNSTSSELIKVQQGAQKEELEMKRLVELQAVKAEYDEQEAEKQKKYLETAMKKKIEEEFARKKYEEVVKKNYKEAMEEKAKEDFARKKYEEEVVKKKYEQEEGATNKATEEAATKKAAEVATAPLTELEQQPILFKDALGRKFRFPFSLCATWKGMNALILQAFYHVDERIRTRVKKGYFNLVNSDGEIVMPTYWEVVVQPGSSITMEMWPLPTVSSDSYVPTRPTQPVSKPVSQYIEIIPMMSTEPEIVRWPSITSMPSKTPSHKKSKMGNMSKEKEKPGIYEMRDDKRRDSKSPSSDQNGIRKRPTNRLVSSLTYKEHQKQKTNKNSGSSSRVSAMATDNEANHHRVSELDTESPGKRLDRVYNIPPVSQVQGPPSGYDIPTPSCKVSIRSKTKIRNESDLDYSKSTSHPLALRQPGNCQHYAPAPTTLCDYDPTIDPTVSGTRPVVWDTVRRDLGIQPTIGGIVRQDSGTQPVVGGIVRRDYSRVIGEDIIETAHFQDAQQSNHFDLNNSTRLSSSYTPHISLQTTSRREDEEEVDELLKEWTTVFG